MEGRNRCSTSRTFLKQHIEHKQPPTHPKPPKLLTTYTHPLSQLLNLWTTYYMICWSFKTKLRTNRLREMTWRRACWGRKPRSRSLSFLVKPYHGCWLGNYPACSTGPADYDGGRHTMPLQNQQCTTINSCIYTCTHCMCNVIFYTI